MTQSENIRQLIHFQAKNFCESQYKESNSSNFAEYDRAGGAIFGGSKNYTRFGYIFDNLLEPAKYAGGKKNGLAWCGMFVANCIGLYNFNSHDRLCSTIKNATEDEKTALKQRFVQNLYNVLGLQSKTQSRAEMTRYFSYLAGVPSFEKFCDLQKCRPSEAKLCDLIVFGSNSHIGFLESFNDGIITTLEGNTTFKAAAPNGGQCCRKTYMINSNGSLTEICQNKSFPSWKSFKILHFCRL